MIYDRWGLKMYEWDGINGSWDGNSKTGTVPDGTYFYIINYTDLRDKSVTEKATWIYLSDKYHCKKKKEHKKKR